MGAEVFVNDWNIQSRGHTCHECEQPFDDGAECHTVLAHESHEFSRRDLCGACWAKGAEGVGDRKGFISHWQGIYEAPPPEPPEVIQKDTAESLLRKLLETGDNRWREASYILAVMLERKRILKVKEQITNEDDGDGRVFVYEQPKSGDLFTIPDPALKMEALERVQMEVATLLEHGLPVEGQPWPPEPKPEPEAVEAAEEPEPEPEPTA